MLQRMQTYADLCRRMLTEIVRVSTFISLSLTSLCMPSLSLGDQSRVLKKVPWRRQFWFRVSDVYSKRV